MGIADINNNINDYAAYLVSYLENSVFRNKSVYHSALLPEAKNEFEKILYPFLISKFDEWLKNYNSIRNNIDEIRSAINDEMDYILKNKEEITLLAILKIENNITINRTSSNVIN